VRTPSWTKGSAVSRAATSGAPQSSAPLAPGAPAGEARGERDGRVHARGLEERAAGERRDPRTPQRDHLGVPGDARLDLRLDADHPDRVALAAVPGDAAAEEVAADELDPRIAL